MTSPVRPYRSRLLLPETLPFTDARERRWFYNYRGAGAYPAPPTDFGHLVWAFDPDQSGDAQAVRGPAGTVTTPTRTDGPPAYYTFGSTDYIDFGDALDDVWTGEDGWTIYSAIDPSAADIAATTAYLVSKEVDASSRLFRFQVSSGKLSLSVYDGGNTSNRETAAAPVGSSLAAGRHVVVASYDPSEARGSRIALSTESGAIVVTPQVVGTQGAFPSGASLRLGQPVGGADVPISVQSYVYGYRGAHDDATKAAVIAWVRSAKGWQ